MNDVYLSLINVQMKSMRAIWDTMVAQGFACTVSSDATNRKTMNWQKNGEFYDSVPFEEDQLVLPINTKHVSDGHHTFGELYEYRMLYNALAARFLVQHLNVVKSRKHHDGEPCFGGGWFIVVIELPTGQVSNHYREEFWDLFKIPEVDLPPKYDGHNSAMAADRLRDFLQL